MRFRLILKVFLVIVLLGAMGVAGVIGYRLVQKPQKAPVVVSKKEKAEKPEWIGNKPAPKTIEPGAYLAALNAVFNDDLEKAANYYLNVLKGDPDNEEIQREAYFFNAILGNFDVLKDVVHKMPEDYRTVFFTHYVQMGLMIQNEDWAGLREEINKIRLSPLDEIIVPMVKAWSYAGEKDYEAAIKALNPLKKSKDLLVYYNYHCGLISLMLGQEFAADEAFQNLAKEKLYIFSMYPEIISFYISRGGWGPDNPLYAQWQEFFKEQPAAAELISLAAASPITAKRGCAEVFYNMSSAMGASKNSYEGALILSALSLYLNPNQNLPKLWSAEILEQAKKPALAAHYYSKLAQGLTQTIDFKRASNLIACGREKEAKPILLKLMQANKDSSQLWWSLASVYQSEKNWPAAIRAYTRILEIEGESNRKRASGIYFARAFMYSAQKNWQKEEQDLLRALDLNPDDPFLLNHLGYKWLENDKMVDKGFELVKRAHEMRPKDPNIMDSIAFGYYRKADYQKALPLAERSVDIMPQSSVTNAHLGDIYHALGRYREAVFQYKKALALKYDLTPELKQELLHKIARKGK